MQFLKSSKLQELLIVKSQACMHLENPNISKPVLSYFLQNSFSLKRSSSGVSSYLLLNFNWKILATNFERTRKHFCFFQNQLYLDIITIQ